MRLLAITSYYKPAYVYGGPVRSNATLFENLAKLGDEVTVITTNANGGDTLDMPLLTPFNMGGVEVIYCPTRPAPGSAFFSPDQIREAKQRIPQNDIVNLQTFWGYATPLLSRRCQKNQIPYYVSLRGQLMDYAMQHVGLAKSLKKRLFLRLVGYNYLNGAAALHCTSALEILQLHNYPIHTLTFLVPNSVDINDYKTLPVRGKLRDQYQIPEEALVMVMIGRLHAKKNPQIAISALIAAQKLHTAVHLMIVGPDEQNLRPALQRHAKKAGCLDHLHFTGLLQKKDLLQAMADSDLLLMPSEDENFGMSAAESMAAGLPILTSDVVPVGIWAKQSNAGEIAAGNAAAFSTAAIKLLSNPTRLKEMGQNGKVAAMTFDNEVVAKEMRAHLERIIAETKKKNDRSI